MVFVVGTDEERAEYYAEGIRCGKQYSLGCSLSDWKDRDCVDYIGIAVYADFDVSLKLERVTAGSVTASPEELEAIFSPPAPAEKPGERNEAWLLPVLIFAAAATFAVFVLLTRRDAEEAGADSGAGGSASAVRTGRSTPYAGYERRTR